MHCYETRVRVSPERMMKIYGWRAEGECNRQAQLAERFNDPDGARRWRIIAEACRQRMGAEIWRADGKLF